MENKYVHVVDIRLVQNYFQGARWRSGRASDSESRDPGFDPHRRHRVVSLSKTHLLLVSLSKTHLLLTNWLNPGSVGSVPT